MKLRVIHSGSDGNSCILKDSQDNQIILDCGLSYETIVANANLSKVDFLLASHAHQDHIKSLDHFKKFYVQTYTYENVHDGVLIDTPHWKILPMKLVHNVECFGFLIFSKIDNKSVAYMTDTSVLRKVAPNTDLIIADTNYSEEIVEQYKAEGKQFNRGCFNHMSLERVGEYIKDLGFKPKHFVAFHLSNSGLCSVEKTIEKLSPLVENLYIAKPNTEINF